jgi:hypothetical protein
MHSSNRWNTSIDQRGGASHDQKGGFAPSDDAPALSLADIQLPTFGPGLGSKRWDTPAPESAAGLGTPLQERGDRASAPAAHRGPVNLPPLVSALASRRLPWPHLHAKLRRGMPAQQRIALNATNLRTDEPAIQIVLANAGLTIVERSR